MKTNAVTIDEATLERLDRVARKNRSRIVRQALQDYLRLQERAGEADRERPILRRRRGRLNRQCAALAREQAKA